MVASMIMASTRRAAMRRENMCDVVAENAVETKSESMKIIKDSDPAPYARATVRS